MILFLAGSPASTSTQDLGPSPWSPAGWGRNLPEPPFMLDFIRDVSRETNEELWIQKQQNISPSKKRGSVTMIE